MMPEECASMRSMARCVLPVLVGPRTAVTPAPRASRDVERENEMGISVRIKFQQKFKERRGAIPIDPTIHPPRDADSHDECARSILLLLRCSNKSSMDT